jgi:hypothetical protein
VSPDFETLKKSIEQTLSLIDESDMEVPQEEELEAFAANLLVRHSQSQFVIMLVRRIHKFIDEKEKNNKQEEN